MAATTSRTPQLSRIACLLRALPTPALGVRCISSTQPSLGGRHTTTIPERISHWRAHVSKSAKKRHKKKVLRMKELASQAKVKPEAAGQHAGGSALLALHAGSGAPALSPVQAAALTRTHTHTNRAILETIAAPAPNIPSPRESLLAMDPDKLLRSLEDGALPWTLRNVNTAVRVLGAHGRFHACVRMLTDMHTRGGLRPDAHTYVALITAAAQQRNMKAAFAAFEAMKAAGLRPSEAAYGALMQACVRAMDLHAAFRVLCEAEAAGLPLTPVLFTHLIVGCIHAGEYDRAFQVYHHMRTHHCMPDAVAYTSIINACAKMDQPEKALGVLTEMRHNGCEPTHVTYNAIMHACARSFRHHARAHDLFREMEAAGHSHDAFSFNSVLLACSHAGEVERAREYMWQMHRSGIAPNAITLNTLLAVYARSLAPTQAALPKAGTELAVRAEGKELLRPAGEMPPSRKVLGSHGRIVEGDVNTLVDSLLADYFADGGASQVDPEEEKILNTSRDERPEEHLPSIKEINQDTANIEFQAARDYLMREKVITKELMADVEKLNEMYPAMDSDGERVEDKILAEEERALKRDARDRMAQLREREQHVAAKLAGVAEKAAAVKDTLSAARSQASASADIAALQHEAVERVVSGRLMFDEVLQQVSPSASPSDADTPKALVSQSGDRVSLQRYIHQLEADIDNELFGVSTARDDSVIGGQSVKQLFDVSDVPPPPTSDAEGEVDPLKLHDHYARVIAERITSAIDKELAPDVERVVDAGSGWSDAEPRISGGPATPLLNAGAAPSAVANNAPADAPSVFADVAAPEVMSPPPWPGAVRRRRSGRHAPVSQVAEERRDSHADSTSEMERAELPLTRRIAPDSAAPVQLETEAIERVVPTEGVTDASAEDITARTCDAISTEPSVLTVQRQNEGATLRPWPRRGSKDYQAAIQEAIARVRGDSMLAMQESASPSAPAFRRRVLARVLRSASLHPLDESLVRAAESQGKQRKRAFERLRPGFMDVMLAARAKGGAEDVSTAHSTSGPTGQASLVPEDVPRLEALQRMSGSLLDGAKWIPRDIKWNTERERRAAIVEEARRVYELEYDANKLARDIVTLNTMMLVYSNAGRASEALALLAEEFPKHSVQPDARTYRALVRMYVRGHDIERAEEAIRRAEASGVTPDADTLGALVHGYARAWRLKDAIAVVQRMKASDMKCAEPYAFLLRQRCKELGIVHPDVPAHPVGWQFTPAVMAKRRAKGKVLNKLVSLALRPKMASGWRA